ncbi:hypothetical protein GALMADRAFT_241213 [Galerina marginata CBS 339.88]|uniref:BTB domain-containing protein n=1 Tax=Galerina marginata (strain CBS 339.88) TaxID=685588 RepID=A0A067TP73_GALM3|nr:hypothetical protein GALMADRAFT_241213 [Galerina marginata CBS 339.88]
MSSQEQLTDANTSTHTIASQPFDDPDGDVVLRTTDNVHFISYKVLLSLASLFFKDMFTHADGADPSQETYDGRSCIAVQDDSDGLYQLLSWWDPRGRPSKALKDFSASLVLADKYGMIGVIKRIEDELVASEAVIKEECVRVYAIARQFHLDNLAKAAARASLSVNLETFPPVEEFGQITGTAVYNLYTYYFQCRRAAQKVVDVSEWDTRSDATSFRKQVVVLDMDTPTLPCCQVRRRARSSSQVTGPTEWRTW